MISSEHFLSKPLEHAIALAKETGVSYRISKQDGAYYILTMDYRPNRVNFDVRDGIVVRAGYG